MIEDQKRKKKKREVFKDYKTIMDNRKGWEVSNEKGEEARNPSARFH
jgi:hypothetical protein